MFESVKVIMGFAVTTLIFAMVGVIASLMVRICCGRGASANLYVLHYSTSCFTVFVREPYHVNPKILSFWHFLLISIIRK